MMRAVMIRLEQDTSEAKDRLLDIFAVGQIWSELDIKRTLRDVGTHQIYVCVGWVTKRWQE
jgi:hypothetical protein